VHGIAVVGPASQAGTDEPESGDASFYNQISNSVNIAGLGIAHAQFLQDGVENVNLLTATANVVSNVEAAQGVTTTLNGSPARFGQPAVINVITKSGSNSFHGSAYDFLQNDDFNATNWFATTKPPVRYNNFSQSGRPHFEEQGVCVFQLHRPPQPLGLRQRESCTDNSRTQRRLFE